MNDYCIVAYYGRHGLRKEIFRGTLSECREKRKKYCRRLGFVYDEKQEVYIYTDTPDGNWELGIGGWGYQIEIKKVKEDNSIYNTIDIVREDEFTISGDRTWAETIEMFKN